MPFLGSFLSEEQFQCSICLEIFDNPVSTPCGHSFCTACIGHYWQGSKLCQCPLCKESFKKRPELHINRTLREITEQFKQMKCEAGACGGSGWLGSSLEERPLKQGGLLGDLFLEMKCQVAKISSDYNVQNGNQSPNLRGKVPKGCDSDSGQSQEVTRRLSLRRYTLSGAADARKVPRCPKHRHKLELFCKSDGECICSECSDTDHQSHKIISVEKEWLISKTEIGMTETKMQEMIGQRLRKIEEIKILLAEIKMAAEKEMQGGMRIFGLLLSSVERSQAELLEVIEMSRRSAEHQAEVMIRELDLELTELRKRSAMLGKLAQTDDCISGLRSYCNLNTPVPVKDWAGVSVHCDLGKTKAIYNSVSQLLQHFREELQKLPEIYLPALIDQSPLKQQPKVKRIQEYADPNLSSQPAQIPEWWFNVCEGCTSQGPSGFAHFHTDHSQPAVSHILEWWCRSRVHQLSGRETQPRHCSSSSHIVRGQKEGEVQ
ncbi:E3 ubiquitin-protein ligase TRIM41 isoform X2 [Electrophorus electricus]|uniref:E3 ubiquitin-protein ligase TRIM41 isoform X2 n=1 Tax=Electrophorus electricus TaxID=8005 RepID=UPI0015D071AB|nr:E3 ubiquitin-protein ligase TRIM41 isoform X2 [Electrophorus electricus]